MAIDWRAVAIAGAFALASLILVTHANDFPSAYHPDEASKTSQVLTGRYNFHHPLLLVTVMRAVADLGGTSDPEKVTIIGRWVSATFTAAAAFCLVLIAAQLAGPFAAVAAGSLLLTNHQLFELAHYFKEDAALLFGISFALLAITLFDRRPSVSRAAIVGATAGLAASAKYVGAAMLPFAIAALWLHRKEGSFGRNVLISLGAAVAVFVLINFPLFLHIPEFAKGFGREMQFAISGHKGFSRRVPHGVYTNVFIKTVHPAMWPLLAIFYISLFRRRREATPAEWMIGLFPISYSLLLSFSPKTNHRYFLPATGVCLLIAGVGAGVLAASRRSEVIQWMNSVSRRWLAFATIAIAVGLQLPRLVAYYNGFEQDNRRALAAYLREHVPPGTTIVQDKRVSLDALGLPYTFRGGSFAADAGSIEKLRAKGIRYFAVAESDYGRFEGWEPRLSGRDAAEFQRRRNFYRRLFAEAELVYEIREGTLQYFQPHLKLYRLR